MADSPESVAYAEALRGIDRQRTVIDGLRTRSSSLFGAASLVTAFLGAQALTRDPELDLVAWIAIVAFVGLFVLVLMILWPWPFIFTLDPKIIIEDHLQKTVTDLQSYLAGIWGKNYDLNQAHVDRLHTLFRGAAAALLLEVVAWLVKLGRG